MLLKESTASEQADQVVTWKNDTDEVADDLLRVAAVMVNFRTCEGMCDDIRASNA